MRRNLSRRGGWELGEAGAVCDFCSAPDPVRRYEVPEFFLMISGSVPFHSAGTAWLACEACAAHVDARDRESLRQRGMESVRAIYPDLSRTKLRAFEQDTRLIHARFFALLDGVRPERKRLTAVSAFEVRNRLLATMNAELNNIGSQGSSLRPFAHTMETASVVLWRNDIWDYATTTCSGVEGSTCPVSLHGTGPQFWFHVDAWEGGEDPGILERFHLPAASRFLGLYVAPSSDHYQPGIEAGMIFTLEATSSEQPYGHIEFARFENQPFASPITGEYCPFIAGLLFMQSEYVGFERHTHPRPARRLAERKKKPLPEVLTVTLRRSYSDPAGERGNGTAPEWSCSWIRSPFWRQQYIPSRGVYEPRFIVEKAVRGDPDKPLRQPKGTVYNVAR